MKFPTASALFLALVVLAPPAIGQAQEARPVRVLPDTIPFETVLQIPGLEAKWVVGTGADSTLYLLRVRLAAGSRLPPHTHPDTRFTQVLSGTIYVGFGTAFDTTRVAAVPAGGVFMTPAETPHFVWARDESVEYQETGVGPTANRFVERPRP